MSVLFALCRATDDAALSVRRVSLTAEVQAQITTLFETQAIQFMDAVTDEVTFGSDWKLDSEEIFCAAATPEIDSILAAMSGNPMALPVVDGQGLAGEGIRGLAVTVGEGRGRRVFIQRFTAQQVLERRWAFLLQGDTFNRITAPAFTLENSIVAIIEDGNLKFKSFANIKRIFSLTSLYQEATDAQIEQFCGHACLAVADVAKFKAIADQTSRKLVFAVSNSGVLDKDPQTIVQSGQEVGLTITLLNGQIVMPTDKKELKLLLRFLDDGVYKAPLSALSYMANSKRPVA